MLVKYFAFDTLTSIGPADRAGSRIVVGTGKIKHHEQLNKISDKGY
jgi:hypothetical protein